MILLALTSLYFILPAYVANMFPVFFTALKLPLGYPISERLFGKNKTYRGIIAGYLGALLILFLQRYLNLTRISLINYQEINLFFYAFLFGGGAVIGDLVKSFFKRRKGIAPGQPWFPFDQLDFIIGALIFVSPFYLLSWKNILVIIVLTPLLHFLTNVIGYSLRIKKVWW